MSHVTTGIRKILENPLFYILYQKLVGSKKFHTTFIKNFIKPFEGAKILDIGCGPGTILNYLPNNVSYVGVDFQKEYIDHAKKTYPNRGTFICNDVANLTEEFSHKFDIVVANSLLHHISDSDAQNLYRVAKQVLKKDGFLLTSDPIYTDDQHKFARYLISKDRGERIRTLDEYYKLSSPYFKSIEHTISHDMFYIPFTFVIFKYSV